MWLQEPGSFTRIIAAMVAPRNTSSETMRPGRAALAAAGAPEAGAEMVSAVEMWRPSNGGDSTAAEEKPQRCDDKQTQKNMGGRGDPGHAFCQREETFAAPRNGERVQGRAALHSGQPAEILVESQIVRAAEHGADEAGALRHPPNVAHPRVSAVHHFLAGEIHQRRPNLNGCVQRSVAGKRPQ